MERIEYSSKRLGKPLGSRMEDMKFILINDTIVQNPVPDKL